MNENPTFVWTKSYMAIADKLLTFKKDREKLLKLLKDLYIKSKYKFPFNEGNEILADVCPFSVFGCFNKNLTDATRTSLIDYFLKDLALEIEAPVSFEGIPVLTSMNAWFFHGKSERGEKDIPNLWKMFEIAIEFADNPSTKNNDDFITTYDIVSKQKGVKWNLTMGLYWIRPFTYLNLDGKNREFFLTNTTLVNGINSNTLKDLPDGKTYLAMVKECKNAFDNGSIEYKSFPELSHAAWLFKPKEVIYYPSLSEYNPGITKAIWFDLLKNENVFNKTALRIMNMYLKQDGEATCAHLSKVYGKTPAYYNMMGSNIAYKVQDEIHCPICMDGDKEKIFPVVFLGRHVSEDNKNRYSWKLRPELQEALNEFDLPPIIIDPSNDDIGKNTILYGPPGTGKTYNTINYAVAIIENRSFDEIKEDSYNNVLKRYNGYSEQGLVEFTTFHQSYSYEEFIEGIKPLIDENETEENIKYIIQPGVFKRFCEKTEIAEIVSDNEYKLNENPTIWKVSLSGTGDNPIRTECLEKGHIRIGWDDYGEFITDTTDFSEGGRNVLNAFINTMRIGDIVMSCYSAWEVDAIGVLTGDYEWDNSYADFKRIRKVNWLAKNIKENIYKINNETVMTLSTIYKLNSVALADVFNIINKTKKKSEAIVSNRVFIVDEINRGNISKIFGELITLIETSKRLGQPEEIRVRLPYSQKLFGVPDNVYIIGTMNTADRSIALIDTALRRRFQFIEMLPDTDVLEGVFVEGIDISGMLKKINERVEALYDRDHTIGHAYFMQLKKDLRLELLADIFKNCIIPLLQEYFYEDFEKIRLVLGDNNKAEQEQFIKVKLNDYSKLFGNTDYSFDDSATYCINKPAFYNPDSYIKI